MNDATHGPGVFSRNHLPYLRRAHGRRVYFRSQRKWVGALELLRHGPASIYFCPIPGDGRIHYAGRLVAVELLPTEQSMAELLARTRARDVASSEEMFWDGSVQTLYVVEVEQLARPFPLTQLRKLTNNEPLSADYGYSYSLVTRPDPGA